MAKRAKKESYPAMLVLAAACAAYRVNGGYFKASYTDLQNSLATNTKIRLTQYNNRALMEQLMADADRIEPGDHDTAACIQAWYRTKLFRVLANQRVSDFEQRVMQMLDSNQCQSQWDLGVLASVPQSYFRGLEADAAQQRAQQASGGYVGTPGQRLELECEVLRANWSQKWNTYYITAVTREDQVVFFSHPRSYDAGARLRIMGTVKRQDNNQTQLNRVRMLV